MDLSRFGAAPPWSLGVEEELMLVDAETLEPARDGFSRVFGEATERIKPELFESFVEITTTVVETPEEVDAQLRALRDESGSVRCPRIATRPPACSGRAVRFGPRRVGRYRTKWLLEGRRWQIDVSAPPLCSLSSCR